MGYPIQQNQTTQPLVFFLTQSVDHISGLTGATPAVLLSKNGAGFQGPAGAVTEIGNGWYQVAANAVDANTLGPLVLHVTATGADPTDDLFPVVSYNPQSATNLGLSNIDVAVSSRLGLTTAVPTTGNTTNSVADCLNGARAQAFGPWTLNRSNNTLTIYAADGVTVIHTFNLDSVSAPTQRS